MAFLASAGHEEGSPSATRPQDGVARWELFHHGADIGVRGYASSKEQAFEQTACALTAVMTEPENVAAREQVNV
ncbi:MAG: archease, partial [Hyphomicrobiales bacterium]